MRIVSLLPSATELVCALGLREQLVGVSHECDFPADVTSLPRLTGSILDHGLSVSQIDAAVAEAKLAGRPIYTVDADLLGSLKPDLIVTQGLCSVCAVTEETVEASLRLIPVEMATRGEVLSLIGTSYTGIRRDVLALGEAAGVADAARAVASEMDRRWNGLAAWDGSSEAAPTTVFVLEWPDPPWYGGHWVPEQIIAAGGVSAFGEPGEPSRRTTWEAVAAADPDLIVAAACGFGVQDNLAHARKILDKPEVASLRAVREGGFWAVDANSYFSRPAPRIVDGAELLHRLIRGEEPPSDAAVRV
jgi:iron complex transport system substrate-binding protein